MSTNHAAVIQRGSFLSGLRVQGRVIAALILRELHTRYGRENIGYLWMIGEPMLLASVIGALHSAAGHNAYGSDMKPLPFAVLGYITFILFRGIVNRSEGALEANGPLLYHRMVTVFDIALSRAFLEFCGTFLTLVVMMTFLICVGLAQPPARPLSVMAAWTLMFFYSLGQSFIIIALSHDNRTLGRLVHTYSYFMVGLSGAFFPMAWLPHPYRDWLQWLPITSVFELARYGWFESAKSTYVHVDLLAASSVILIWIGLVLMARVRDKIHLS